MHSPEDPNRRNPVGVEIDAACFTQGSSQARNPSLSAVAPLGHISVIWRMCGPHYLVPATPIRLEIPLVCSESAT